MIPRDEENYVSVGQWMLLLIIPSIPVIGWILVIVLAFTGENQTRKNYFRAMLVWILLIIVLATVLVVTLAVSPALMQQVKDWEANHHH